MSLHNPFHHVPTEEYCVDTRPRCLPLPTQWSSAKIESTRESSFRGGGGSVRYPLLGSENIFTSFIFQEVDCRLFSRSKIADFRAVFAKKFGPFQALKVFWSKNCKKCNGGPLFCRHRLNFHHFLLKFWKTVAKINFYPSYFLEKYQIQDGNGRKNDARLPVKIN